MFNAGPLDVTWAKLSLDVDVIMACFFPAQSTGDALYRSLTAADAQSVPAARLPATWPANLEQVGPTYSNILNLFCINISFDKKTRFSFMKTLVVCQNPHDL